MDLKEKKGSFWLTVSEVSAHGCQLCYFGPVVAQKVGLCDRALLSLMVAGKPRRRKAGGGGFKHTFKVMPPIINSD